MILKLKISSVLAVFILGAMTLTGCNSNLMTVSIYDCQTQTKLTAREGRTVEQLLAEAEITIDKQDVVTPALDEKITGKQAEIRIDRHANVTVTEEDEITVELTGGKVQDALGEAGVTLVKNDFVDHNLEAYLTDGMQISVVHRMAISLVADGKTTECLTQVNTVQELLEEQRIELGKLDRVTPKVSAELFDGAEVVVKRVEIKEVVEKEPIDFETIVTYSNSMEVGTSRITKEGVNGEKRVTYQVTYVDGKEESRKVIKEEVLKEAVNQEIVQGSKPKGKTVVSKQRVEDCDGSGHGYYIITYSDGTVEYQDF